MSCQCKSSTGVMAKEKVMPEVCMHTGQKVDFLRGNKIHTENPKEE